MTQSDFHEQVLAICRKLTNRIQNLDPYFRDDEQALLSISDEIAVAIRVWYAAQRADLGSPHSRGLRDPNTPRGRAWLEARRPLSPEANSDDCDIPQSRFCSACGELAPDKNTGRIAIDEDGCCQVCGRDTCEWYELEGLLQRSGFILSKENRAEDLQSLLVEATKFPNQEKQNA